MLQQVGVRTKREKTFQTSLQKSPRLKNLFNGDLEEQVNSLKTLAEDAEATWWEMAQSEFLNGGEVSVDATYEDSPALAAVQEMCASAETLMNQILSELNTILAPDAEVELNWAEADPVPTDYALKSFYGPYVADVCDKLLTKIATMKTMLGATQNFAEFNSRVNNLKSTYVWTATEFQKFGPNFPTVLCDFHSNSTLGKANYNRPQIGAGIDDTNKTLMLLNYPAGEDASNIAFLADGSAGFHQLKVNDIVLLAKLEIEDYEDLVGRQYTIGDMAASLEGVTNAMELTVGTTDFEEIVTNLTEKAAAVGENFVLRKIVSAAV